MADGMTPRVSGVPRPVDARSRVESLDVIRGFALLGILGPNIIAFAWPQMAMYEPGAMGQAAEYLGRGVNAAANQIGHTIVEVFFFGKMMLLFSLLFGAGVVMYARKFEGGPRCRKCKHDLTGLDDRAACPECGSRKRARANLADGAGLWYTRSAWLLVFGLLHAFGLWYGDILVWYAVAALGMTWWIRRLEPMALMVLGGAMYLGGVIMMLLFMIIGLVAQEHGHHDFSATVIPEVVAYRGSYLQAFWSRVPTLVMMYVIMIPIGFFWMASGMFAWGIALTKLGVLTGERSTRFYARLALFGLGGGLALTAAVLALLHASGTPMPGFVFQGVGQLVGAPISLGYAATMILLLKLGALRPLTSALAAVGRMALSNYFLQTLICTTLFYGYGFGYFAEIQYPWLFVVMGGIWAVNIVFSLLWLHFFRFGPAEWVWRSLTYMSLQPMRRASAVGGPASSA